jgi:hypothetical protein
VITYAKITKQTDTETDTETRERGGDGREKMRNPNERCKVNDEEAWGKKRER